MTTRRRRLQVLAVLYVLAGAALIAWAAVEASNPKLTQGSGAVWGFLLLTGLAMIFVVPAWGLWHGTRWGLVSAFLLAWLMFMGFFIEKINPAPALLCLVALLVLNETIPKPRPLGGRAGRGPGGGLARGAVGEHPVSPDERVGAGR